MVTAHLLERWMQLLQGIIDNTSIAKQSNRNIWGLCFRPLYGFDRMRNLFRKPDIILIAEHIIICIHLQASVQEVMDHALIRYIAVIKDL